MVQKQYGSVEFYRVLVSIHAKVIALPCRGVHEGPADAYTDLMEYISKEREACSIRAAAATAQSRRRQRLNKELTADESRPE